ncbi:MAG: hypothetical protein ACPG7F_19920 [Aggregatilineales bacterium]
MQIQPYSLTQREDGIYIARFQNHHRDTLEVHFDHLLNLYKDYPPNTPVYMVIRGSDDKLPSVRYVVSKIQQLYSRVSAPKPLYVAFVYPRDDAILSMFVMMLDVMRLNAPRQFFRDEEAAIAWLQEQQLKQDTIDRTP